MDVSSADTHVRVRSWVRGSQLQETAKYAPEMPTEEDLAADPNLAQVPFRHHVCYPMPRNWKH